MKGIIKLITGLSLKGKIVAALVATTIVGGSATGAVIISKENKDKAENNKVASASIQKEANEQISKATNQENSKVEEVKPAEQTKVEEKKEDTKESSDNKQSTTENKPAASNTSASNNSAKTSTSSNNTTSSPKSNTSNNAGTTTKPSQPTPPPTQKPAEPAKPTRASGIDWDLTNQINGGLPYVKGFRKYSNGRADDLIQASVSIAFNNSVPDNIKAEWLPNPDNPDMKFKYMSHTVNIISGTSTYSYLGFKNPPDGFNNGFLYCIAYWDSGINNYKLYYVKIRLA